MNTVTTLLILLPYCIQALAFVVKRPLWLRIGLVVGFALELLYWIYIPHELQYIHIAGTSILLLINLFQALILVRARQLDSWSDEACGSRAEAVRLPDDL